MTNEMAIIFRYLITFIDNTKTVFLNTLIVNRMDLQNINYSNIYNLQTLKLIYSTEFICIVKSYTLARVSSKLGDQYEQNSYH